MSSSPPSYTVEEVDAIMEDSSRSTLEKYCQSLAAEYDIVRDGNTRIVYNALYTALFSPLTSERRADFFNTFASHDIATNFLNKYWLPHDSTTPNTVLGYHNRPVNDDGQYEEGIVARRVRYYNTAV